MQSTIDEFNKAHSVPQIYCPRNGAKYVIMKNRLGLKTWYRIDYRVIDCSGWTRMIVRRNNYGLSQQHGAN